MSFSPDGGLWDRWGLPTSMGDPAEAHGLPKWGIYWVLVPYTHWESCCFHWFQLIADLFEESFVRKDASWVQNWLQYIIRVNYSISNLFANHHKIELFSWTNLHKGGPTGSPRSSSDLAQTSSSFSNMLGIPSWRFHSAGPWMPLDVPGHSTWVRVASEEPNITQSLSC